MNIPTSRTSGPTQPLQNDRVVVATILGAALLTGIAAVIAPWISLLFIVAGMLSGVFIQVLPRWTALALFVFLLAFQFDVVGPFGAELSPQNMGVFLLLILLLDSIWRRRIRLPHVYLGLVVAAYAAISLLAIGFGPLMRQDIRDVWVLYRLVLIGPLAYFVFAVEIQRSEQIRQTLVYLVLGASAAGFVGLAQTVSSGEVLSGIATNHRYLGFLHRLPNDLIQFYTDNPRLWIEAGSVSIFRAHGTFEHANAYGVFLSAVLFLTWGLYVTSSTLRARLIWLGLIACQFGGVLVSFSRSAWVALFAGALLLLILEVGSKMQQPRRLVRPLIGVFLIGVTGLVAIQQIPVVQERVQSLFTPQEVGELRWRFNIWRYVGEQILANPFMGAGTTVIRAVDVGFGDELESFSSHNLLLSLAYERGLVALLLYGTIVTAYMLAGWRLFRDAHLREAKELAAALLAAMVAFQVSGSGSASMNYAGLSILFWLMVALMFAVLRSQQYDDSLAQARGVVSGEKKASMRKGGPA